VLVLNGLLRRSVITGRSGGSRLHRRHYRSSGVIFHSSPSRENARSRHHQRRQRIIVIQSRRGATSSTPHRRSSTASHGRRGHIDSHSPHVHPRHQTRTTVVQTRLRFLLQLLRKQVSSHTLQGCHIVRSLSAIIFGEDIGGALFQEEFDRR